MHILVYGANGWIGGQFTDILDSQNIAYTRGTSRVDQADDVVTELDRVVPSHVVSFIGRTHGTIDGKAYTTIDYLEEKGKLVENVRDNLFSPLVGASSSMTRTNTHGGRRSMGSGKRITPTFSVLPIPSLRDSPTG